MITKDTINTVLRGLLDTLRDVERRIDSPREEASFLLKSAEASAGIEDSAIQIFKWAEGIEQAKKDQAEAMTLEDKEEAAKKLHEAKVEEAECLEDIKTEAASIEGQVEEQNRARTKYVEEFDLFVQRDTNHILRQLERVRTALIKSFGEMKKALTNTKND